MKNKKGKKQKIANIHDSFVKYNFGTKEGLIAFLQSCLRRRTLRNIDLQSIQFEGNEFLPNRYRNGRRSDIVVSVKNKKDKRIYLLLLIEAQSRHDKYMAARILEYHASIAFAHLRRGNQRVPMILTFVIYHGKQEWTSPKSIPHLFQDFKEYVSTSLKVNFLVHHSQTEAIKKLRKEGKAEGIKEGQKTLLKKLLDQQINIALLAEATGMTPEALQNL